MMMPSINATLKKRLVAESKMEAEEIDALWDQFTCLAGTEWPADPNNIGWALDRRAFNHAFIPRYNSFVAAPNLIYDRIFAYYDSDKNGLIGFEEWIKGLDGMHSSHIKSRIVFNAYDVDGDGYISRKDILRIFRAYYAIEKEATRNYVAEITEELSVRNALETIRSSQPLGSAFPPHGPTPQSNDPSRLQHKAQDDSENTEGILHDDHADVADREDMLRAANFRNISEEALAESGQDDVVIDRWSRRQFYVDEEEGLARPEGMEDNFPSQDGCAADATNEAEDDETFNGESDTRPRCSRSSSRVRFEDDVDIETRSNASTSSRPVGERWGGYEIPEPEKDLGQEVLYQITQQGFNELLDPMFEERENDAMDAHATRAERRQCADTIDEVTDSFKNDKRQELRAICMMGIFRYSECIMEMFCDAVNKSSYSGMFRSYFFDNHDRRLGTREARERLLRAYSGVEDALLKTISVPDEYTVTAMCLWNTWLCREQLRNELLAACLDSATHLGWTEAQSDREDPLHVPSSDPSASSVRRDPTMPQFRPNSLVELLGAGQSSVTAQETRERDSPANPEHSQSETYAEEDANMDGIRSQPKGPFFVYYYPRINLVSSSGETAAAKADPPFVDQASTPSQSEVGGSALVERPSTSAQDIGAGGHNEAEWHSYKNDPVIHALCIHTSNGAELVEAYPRPVIHARNPYYTGKDQLMPLYRLVREVAMDPASTSHSVLLASLEAVQSENYRRKGNGLINFEEFDEHMREGKLRFLESWMEWVSI
jgi:Ca2+-binding EF-hand superfamily protein